MTADEHKYWAFLCFSPEDNPAPRPDAPAAGRRSWGDWLHDALKTFSIPQEFIGQINGRGEIIPERIHPLFREAPDLSDEAGLNAESRQALEQSTCLIVICSPHSANSRRVNEAVSYFKQLGRGKNILPIVIAGEPNVSERNPPGGLPAAECLVPALRHPVLPDGSVDMSRRAGRFIFVDARHGIEKREILANDDRHAEADLEMAKIQLIALLLGVGFNGLWWREQKKHFYDLTEARHQIREALNQVAEAQRQTRAAQDQALERQNLPRDVHGQIQAAQTQAQEALNQARAAEKQLQEFQNQVRDTQTQLEAARHRALAAENKVLEARQQTEETRNQLEASRQQASAAENQVLEMQNLAQAVPNQIQEAQNQILEAQKLAQHSQSQLEEAREQVREAQNQVAAIQNLTRDVQSQIQAAQNKTHRARRLARIFALLAVLSLLTAGVAMSLAWRQRKLASQALTQAAAAATGKLELVTGGLDRNQMRQTLGIIGGAEPDENRRHSLDELAAGIPREEITDALKASVVIADDQERSHFQKWLLVRLGWMNPLSAMTNASALDGKIVNEAGQNDSDSYFQLAVLDNWMQTDLPGAINWACQLPDADARSRALEQIIHWVNSQPDSETKNKALATCLDELEKTDPSATLKATNQVDLTTDIMQMRSVPWPWTKFLPTSDFGSLTIDSVEAKLLSISSR